MDLASLSLRAVARRSRLALRLVLVDSDDSMIDRNDSPCSGAFACRYALQILSIEVGGLTEAEGDLSTSH